MRFIDDGWRTGAENMARDEALSLGVGEGSNVSTLRVYRFSPPCVTVGRFQDYPAGLDLRACREMGIDVVRRPTGGLAIPHIDDFTYSVNLPSGRPGVEGETVFRAVADGILASLEILGVDAEFAAHHARIPASTPWCFDSAFGVDLEWHGRKICGSAQRRASACILQHGSLFLSSTDAALARITGTCSALDTEPERALRPVSLEEAAGRTIGWSEVRDAFILGFERAFGEALEAERLTPSEELNAAGLHASKYGTARWLEGHRTP